MVAVDRVKELFDDALQLQARAEGLLAQGDVRDAAEKAWCATRQATNALILVSTGREPETSTQTSAGIRRLAHDNPDLQPLRVYFSLCAKELHSDCFYDGHCEPVEETAITVRRCAQFLQDVRRAAGQE